MSRQPSTSRKAEYRVAIPIEQPAGQGKSALIPEDVWRSYQQEVAQAEREASELNISEPELLDEPEEVSELDLVSEENELELSECDLVSAENEVGPVATTPADPEVALFALSQVPLFSGLPTRSLEKMAAESRQGELASGEYLFREGDPAHSFFVMVDGAVEILRRRDGSDVALRHMSLGDAIGLLGLFSGQVRAACARAIGEAVVLEVPSQTLGLLVQSDDALHDRVLKFYQERLLEGFLASSKLFADIDAIARGRVIGQFAERVLKSQETLVHPGEVSNLIAVIISGRLMLEDRPRAGQDPRQFELLPGQFLAVTSALGGAPSKMRIWATEPTSLAMLGHKELTQLMKDYPALRSLPGRLRSASRCLERDVYCGHTGLPGL